MRSLGSSMRSVPQSRDGPRASESASAGTADIAATAITAGAVIFSSHDRFLLDRVATKVAELEAGKLKIYHGGWTAYREAKGELPIELGHEQAASAA